MKKIILSVALMLSLTVVAQTTERNKIAQESSFTVYETITSGDTSYYYYFSFQNQKYTQISDLGSILLYNKEQVLLMSDKLKEMASIDEKKEIIFNDKRFSLALYEFSNNIYLMDAKGKYTTLTKNKALKLSESLLLYVNYLKE